MKNSIPEQISPRESLLAVACITLIFVIIVSKILPLSLWLDECGTYWIIKDGVSTAIDRAIRYQGQSPFYYLTALASLTVFGKSEFAMRLPSLIGIALSAWILWLVAKELIGEIGAPFAALIFLSRDDVLRALSARPYALGLICVLCSVLALLRWLNTARRSWLLFYVVSTAAVWYAHFLFAPVGVLHLAIFLLMFRHERAKSVDFCVAIGVIVLLILPGFSQFTQLLARKESLVVAAPPKPFDLLRTIVPGDLLVFLMAGVLCGLAFIKGSRIYLGATFKKGSLGVLILWLILPPGILFGWSLLTGSSLYLGRYFIWYLPALAIISGAVLSGLSSSPARIVALLAVTILVCVKDLSTPLVAEDWRGAIAAINHENSTTSERLVLLYSGLVEANNPSWLVDPERGDYLSSPLSFYPVFAKVRLLPAEVESPANSAYFSQNLMPMLIGYNKISVIALERRMDSNGKLRHVGLDGFKAALTKIGFDSKNTDSFGQVDVGRFSKELESIPR